MGDPTLRAALAAGRARLRAAGVVEAAAHARRLMAVALGEDEAGLLRRGPESRLPLQELAAFQELLRRRGAGEPLQHLLGRVRFGDLELEVGPGAFIPRPETESLVDLAARLLPGGTQPRAAVDLGAGTGAIALSLARRLPAAEVAAVERSAAARRWLERNARARAAAGDRPIEIVAADFGDMSAVEPGGPLAALRGRVDLIVSNPPYVPDGTLVPREVRHDPAAAVFAGPDGLDAIRALLPVATALLAPGGALALEHDESHQDAVLELLRRGGLVDVRGHADLTGRPRFATAASTVPASERMGR